MFRDLRRIKQQLTPQECHKILKEERRAVLAVHGDNGYPYAIPVNFFFDQEENKIFIHCSKEGHKLDAIRKNSKVCLTLYDQGYQKDDWSYYVKSVVVFGQATEMNDGPEKYNKCKALGAKYIPTTEELEHEMDKAFSRVNMLCITIDHISGKLVHEK